MRKRIELFWGVWFTTQNSSFIWVHGKKEICRRWEANLAKIRLKFRGGGMLLVASEAKIMAHFNHRCAFSPLRWDNRGNKVHWMIARCSFMSASYCLRHRRYSSSFNYSTKVVKYDSKTSRERYISVDANASDILLLIKRVFEFGICWGVLYWPLQWSRVELSIRCVCLCEWIMNNLPLT